MFYNQLLLLFIEKKGKNDYPFLLLAYNQLFAYNYSLCNKNI